ncbi:MAG: LysM peptidoglycan-binding domain-containing protein, partial [Solirubrobacteraceae bacterium]
APEAPPAAQPPTALDDPEPKRTSARPATVAAEQVPASGSATATAVPLPVEPAPVAGGDGAASVRAGDRRHVVRSGESLWSIAAQLAGSGASPAAIARIVDELWRLNADRIASGDPDLIHVGTALVLPAR